MRIILFYREQSRIPMLPHISIIIPLHQGTERPFLAVLLDYQAQHLRGAYVPIPPHPRPLSNFLMMPLSTTSFIWPRYRARSQSRHVLLQRKDPADDVGHDSGKILKQTWFSA